MPAPTNQPTNQSNINYLTFSAIFYFKIPTLPESHGQVINLDANKIQQLAAHFFVIVAGLFVGFTYQSIASADDVYATIIFYIK